MATVLECARMASDVYNTSNVEAPGWARGAVHGDHAVGAGFFGATYSRGNEVVISFRGSVEREDWTGADYEIGRGQLPISQLGDALGYMNAVSRAAAARGITRLVITGHSLGGGLAQLATSIRPATVGVTFNAPGCQGLQGAVRMTVCNTDVWNYRTNRDPVSGATGTPIGRPHVSLPVPPTVAEQVLGIIGGIGGRAIGYAAGSGNEHRMALMFQALGASSEAGRVI